MKMKMNTKTTGIVFLLACLFITLFIGQWFNLRSYSSAATLGKDNVPMLEGFREGAKTKMDNEEDDEDEEENFDGLTEQDMKGVASGAGKIKELMDKKEGMNKKEGMDKKEYMNKKEGMDKKEYMNKKEGMDKKESMKKNTEGFREGNNCKNKY
jgi:hypothetical protein